MSLYAGRDKSYRTGELLTDTINFSSISATLDNSMWQEKDHVSSTIVIPFGIHCIIFWLICIKLDSAFSYLQINK